MRRAIARRAGIYSRPHGHVASGQRWTVAETQHNQSERGANTPPHAEALVSIVKLRTADLDYKLPESCIATEPATPRDAAKLMFVERANSMNNGTSTNAHSHLHINDLPQLLRPNDLLILNNTRVLPARFLGERADTQGKAEGLYLGPGPREGTWRVLLKMKRQRPGITVSLFDPRGRASGVQLRLLERDTGPAANGWTVEVLTDEQALPSALNRVGLTPLPPYILAARRAHDAVPSEEIETIDRTRYQTVFAEQAHNTPTAAERGSVAAPTAGLHFTPELLAQLSAMGVRRATVTLHVGLGTFKPVECEYVDDHPMHSEWCVVPPETVHAIEETRARCGRIVAVGTTSVRTLESFASLDDMRDRGAMGISTNILITPGFRFRFVDALLTNFHLPRSTLMSLVGAFIEQRSSPGTGIETLKSLYTEAIACQYRFYSYGDAMLIV